MLILQVCATMLWLSSERTLITLCLAFDFHVKFLEIGSCMSSLLIYPQDELLDTVQGTLALSRYLLNKITLYSR